MFRKILTAFAVFVALMGASESVHAQNMQGEYDSTKTDGTPITPGYTYIIEVNYLWTDWDGTEHYETRARIIKNSTGKVVVTGQPGSLVWHPWLGFGDLVGSNGGFGTLWPDGGGSFTADYSASGGNTRQWTRK
tara:strand:+ start:23880 stop:24281 length:402 start_codon:yes stop_codon:yes gene_type:complete